jgi:hypothetical protein
MKPIAFSTANQAPMSSDTWALQRKVPYYTTSHTTPHTTLHSNKNGEAFRQRKNQAPMSSDTRNVGRRIWLQNLFASMRMVMMLFTRAMSLGATRPLSQAV